MSAAIARMSSACFKPLYSNTVTLLLFADFPLGKSVFLFFTASLRRFGAVFRLCCSAAAYVPLLLVHLQNGLYALIQLGIQLLQARCDILMYGLLGYSEPCRSLPHGGLLLDHVLRQTDRALLR